MGIVLEVPRTRRPATVAAMVVVAIVAIFQSAVICLSIGAQRDAAHIIDVSGAQRMRSQKLAFLALSLYTRTADPRATRAEIDATLSAMAATRVEIKRDPRYDSGPRDAEGHTALGRLADAYLRAVRAVERDPRDATAIAQLFRERPIVLASFQTAVEKRVAVVNARNDEIVAALLVGLILQLASIAGVWYRIVAPAERRSEAMLADVLTARKEIESTFDENPDAISVYGADGRLLRVNSSRARLLGHDETSVLGRPYTDFFDADHVGEVEAVFARACAGETVRLETRGLASDGSLVDVSMTVFPRVIDGVLCGVNVVSKDMRKLRAAEAENAEQQRRIADLYEIASAHGRTTDQLLESALSLVAVRLGYDCGVISEIVEELETVVATYGSPMGLQVGKSRPLATSLSRISIATDIFQTRDFHASAYASDATRKLDWRGVAGMKILVGGVLYGTVGFASRTVRESDLSNADIGFMRLACALFGTIIERGRQLRRLDSLAFNDSLTALPNRASFTRELAACVAAGFPFALHYIDLDRFKKVNDRYGHAVGDTVLRVTAKRLLQSARTQDVVARLGGDEFAIIQIGPIDRAAARALGERVVAAFSGPIDLGGIRHDVGASVGIALFPNDGADGRDLVEAADTALYRAKRGGRRRVSIADDISVLTAPG